jgi:hypothetical protein
MAGSDETYIGCRIMVLPQHQWVGAAKTAVTVNPANAPAAEMFALGAPGQVIEPEHLALLTAKYWGTGGVRLTVGFLDNPPLDLQTRILAHMNAWGAWCNVSFLQTAHDPQVRIARGPGGYWSNLGTDILSVDAASPTMNLQDFTMNTPDSEFFRVVRHETGHTLGFPHEHRRREIVDRIDKDKAIAFFLANQGWDAAMTTEQVLTPFEDSALTASALTDVNSIMCYALPGSIMKDGVAVPGGTDIDSQDATFAAGVYPRPVSQSGSGILWHHSDTNETQIWFMDDGGGRVTGRATVLGEDGNAAFVGLPFSIVGVGDFNRDGNADILWHHSDTNETQIWFMDGGGVSRRGTVLGEDGNAAFVGLPFSIVGVGDFNRA